MPLTVDIPRAPSCAPCRFVASSHKLGSGAYGAVLLGTDLCTSQPVAIKFIPDGRMRPASLEREVQMLRRLSEANHPALVKFHAHVRPAEIESGEVRAVANASLPLAKSLGSYHALVMEVARGGELFDRVVRADGLQESESAPICAQLVDAVRAAHSLGIAHRDLKLENVLLVGRGEMVDFRRIKLVDWGLAHQHALAPDGSVIHEKLHSRCGSRSYMAPEVTNRELSAAVGYNGFAADVWSLGVCLFAIHLGFFPFEQADPEQDWRARRVVSAQREGRSTMGTILTFYPQRSSKLSAPLLALIDRMLVFDPKKRASLTEVLCSEWLAPHVPACCPMQLDLASARINTVTVSRMSDSSCTSATDTDVLNRQDSGRSGTSMCSSVTSCSTVTSGKPTMPRRFANPPSYLPPTCEPFAIAAASAAGERCVAAAAMGGAAAMASSAAAAAGAVPLAGVGASAPAHDGRRTSLKPPPSTPPPEPHPTVVVAGSRQILQRVVAEQHSSLKPGEMSSPPQKQQQQREQKQVSPPQKRPSDEHGGASARDFLTELFAKKCKLARSRSARGAASASVGTYSRDNSFAAPPAAASLLSIPISRV